MKLIDLDNNTRAPANHTSKGDQPKWELGGKWYKADHLGYEALSEVLVSRLLEHSNATGYVSYAPVMICADGKRLCGCVSRNFRGKDEALIPLEKLHRAYTGRGLASELSGMPEVSDRVKYTVEFVESKTGFTDFGRYLTLLLELDAFFLNEDRHTNNIAVIVNERTGKFRPCPIFDNGLSLLADVNDYPTHEDIFACIDRVKAKPFSQDFDEQVECAAALYGPQLKFYFSRADVVAAMKDLGEYYTPEYLERALDTITEQMRKYKIYF